MDDGPSFYEPLKTGGRRERRVTALVVVALIAVVGIAIAKPWSSPDEPAPSTQLSQADARSPVASLQTTAPAVPSVTPATPTAAPSVAVRPLPVAIILPVDYPGLGTGLSWRRLAPDDPLSLVTSMLFWRGGFIAVGREAGPPATPVWTSADGTVWGVLPFGTSTTFWPGMFILGVVETRTGLVALGETVEYCAEPCPPTFELPVISWTSPDGWVWTPHVLPPEWFASPTGQPPLFATGPAGLVVASSGRAARLATSTDGSDWHLLPADPFPASFELHDIRGTATGYVAAGRWVTPDLRSLAASFWSGDGRHWSEEPTFLPTTPEEGLVPRSDVTSLVVGRDGVIAVGRDVTTSGATLWWQSPDGRRWVALPTWPPLGTRTPCDGEGCGTQPNGTLAGDGERTVALRGGTDAGAWISSDGLAWRRLTVTGDIPSEQATHAVLLPGGVLLSDGSTTWFGEAQGP